LAVYTVEKFWPCIRPKRLLVWFLPTQRRDVLVYNVADAHVASVGRRVMVYSGRDETHDGQCSTVRHIFCAKTMDAKAHQRCFDGEIAAVLVIGSTGVLVGTLPVED